MSNIWNWAYWALKAAKADNLLEEKGSPILLKEDKEYGERIYAPNTEYTRLVRVLEARGEAEGLVAPENQNNYHFSTLQSALVSALEEIAFDASPWEEAQHIAPRWMRASKRLPREAFTADDLLAVVNRNNQATLRSRQGTQGDSGRHNQWAPAQESATPARQAERKAKKHFNRAWDRARLSGVGADLCAVLNRVTSTINNLSITAEEKALSEAAIARLARRAARKADRKAKRMIRAALKAAETAKAPKGPKAPKAPKTPKTPVNKAQIAELVAAIRGRLGFDAFIGAIQNHPESTINNLSTTSENLSADYKRCLTWIRKRLGISEPRFRAGLAAGNLSFSQELKQAFWNRFVRVAQPVDDNRIKQINSAFGSAK